MAQEDSLAPAIPTLVAINAKIVVATSSDEVFIMEPSSVIPTSSTIFFPRLSISLPISPPAPSAQTDQGKVPQSSLRNGRDAQAFDEPEAFVDMNVYSDDSSFQNSKLAHQLIKAIILPRD